MQANLNQFTSVTNLEIGVKNKKNLSIYKSI